MRNVLPPPSYWLAQNLRAQEHGGGARPVVSAAGVALGAFALGALAGALGSRVLARWRAQQTLTPSGAAVRPGGQLFGLGDGLDVAVLLPQLAQVATPWKLAGAGPNPTGVVSALTKPSLIATNPGWPGSLDEVLGTCRTDAQIELIRSELSVVLASRRVLDSTEIGTCAPLSLPAQNLYNVFAAARVVPNWLPVVSLAPGALGPVYPKSLYDALAFYRLQITVAEAQNATMPVRPRFYGDMIVADESMLSRDTLTLFGNDNTGASGLYSVLEHWAGAASAAISAPEQAAEAYAAGRRGFANNCALGVGPPFLTAAQRLRISELASMNMTA